MLIHKMYPVTAAGIHSSFGIVAAGTGILVLALYFFDPTKRKHDDARYNRAKSSLSNYVEQIAERLFQKLTIIFGCLYLSF